ncbi:MAG: metallophosphoesterase [Hyphomicrobiaceae bacterium]
MLTIAHFSDVHLGPMPRPRIRDLTPKRLTGLANWHRRRKLRHLPDVLRQLIDDARRHSPDHIVVTGDLCNIGMPAEMAAALGWLERLGPPEHVTVVPGNHDAYVRLRGDPGVARWTAYMSGDQTEAVKRRGEPVPFPFVRRLGRVALVGLSSAVPTPVFRATGRLGTDQREAAARVLRRLDGEGLLRIVLIHHPPLPGQASPARRLIDAEAFAAVLKEAGAELVLHGHNHKAMLAYAEGPAGSIPVVGVPSASLAEHHHDDLARYNLYRIVQRGEKHTITLEGRAITPGLASVETVEQRALVER